MEKFSEYEKATKTYPMDSHSIARGLNFNHYQTSDKAPFIILLLFYLFCLLFVILNV